MFDIIIRGGKIVDGSGKKPFEGDVGIKRNKIYKVGDLEMEVAQEEIDAKGKIVTPGFVDINNHSDTYWTLFKYPDQESLLKQGITTILGGNCGSSLAPILGEGSIKSLRKWARMHDLQIDWDRVGEFLSYLEDNRPLGVNFGTLVGHATLRRGLLGEEIRRLRSHEIDILEKEVERSIKEGAWGFSTGLTYTHARIASKKELTALAKAVQKARGIYTTHLRGEGEDLITSIKEALKIAKSADSELEISHLKALGRSSWPLFERALKLIEEAQKEGVKVNFDIYPYTYSGPVLYTLLPGWITEGNKEMLLEKLKKPANRLKVIAEMKKKDFDYSKVIVASSPLGGFLVNKKIDDIAKVRNTSCEEVIVDLVMASEDHGTMLVNLLSEKNVANGLTHPLSVISTDGIGYDRDEYMSGDLAHPRCFGAFARVLSYYVKEKNTLKLEEAVWKMSGLPAEKIGMTDRGGIKEGLKADVNIIDWDKVKDRSTIESPYVYASGFEYVIVNGRVSVSKGEKVKGVRSGEILRKK